jgi:hypothetical protein
MKYLNSSPKIKFKNLNLKKLEKQDKDIIIQNIYPVGFMHCLFLPHFFKCMPQFISDISIIERVFHLIKKFSSSNLCLGYNSKGASSSINNLHFQMYFLDKLIPEFNFKQNEMIFEKISENCDELFKSIRFNVSFCHKPKIISYFKLHYNRSPKIKPEEYIKCIFKIIQILNSRKIPYNILFFNKSVYIFPRKFQHKMEGAWLGVNELIGAVLLYEEDEYKDFNFEKLVETFKKAQIDEEILEEIKGEVKGMKEMKCT